MSVSIIYSGAILREGGAAKNPAKIFLRVKSANSAAASLQLYSPACSKSPVVQNYV